VIAADKPPLEGVYLAHFGIKGMKWGQRKAPEEGAPRRPGLSSRNQKLVTAAFVAGTVAVGAVMLSRGNVSVWNSNSNRIALGGAKMSASILGKTGKVVVKGSAKTAKVVGKAGFKVGTGTAKVTGKLAAKATVAASKAAAESAVTNGSKFYKEILAPAGRNSTKLGSAAMFKLTGIGTPWVSSAPVRRMSLSPVELLLNTRADRPGGG
jgi:hypothetical protein